MGYRNGGGKGECASKTMRINAFGCREASSARSKERDDKSIINSMEELMGNFDGKSEVTYDPRVDQIEPG